ncbi:alpha/beta fold hydrolase [Nocardiopsis potens]|uniref:alpha/beta fold hydrolase n=1 Tax=Nocardiopsis potens TaxID=1246458 RepID=UPI00034BB763|nr:alpha/beta fold hydrolase [Nocardiopsis potens]
MSHTSAADAAAPRLRYAATADGLRLAVREHGDPAAPTLLCVHGFPDDSSVWDGVAARLADRYHVVAYDVRGAGASTAPRHRSGYALDRLADDMARVARTASPDGPVHLLAHDWGSIAAWHAVTDERHAPAFASYTSISGPCLDHAALWLRSRLRPSPRALRAFADQAVRSGYIAFFHLPVLPELAWLTGIGGAVLGALDRIGRPPAGSPPPRRALRDHINGLGLYRENFRPRLRAPAERRTAVPVQVLLPADEVFMTEGAQTAAARWTEDFRAVPVEGGHWMPRSRPGAVAERVHAFVRGLGAAGPR